MGYDKVSGAVIDYLASGRSDTGKLRAVVEAKYPGAISRARARVLRERHDSKFTGNPPAWAIRFCDKYAPNLDSLRWHRSKMGTFHGTCYGYEVSVTVPEPFPADRLNDAKIVVLHEIAHHKAMGDGHGPRFQDAFYRLLSQEGLYRASTKAGFSGASGLRAAARRARAKAVSRA